MFCVGLRLKVSVFLSHRKRCLLLNTFVAILGSVLMLLSKTAMSFEMIMAGRFFFGINSGNLLSKLTGASFPAVQTVTSLNLVRLCMCVVDFSCYFRSQSCSLSNVRHGNRSSEAERDCWHVHWFLHVFGEVLWPTAGDQVR